MAVIPIVYQIPNLDIGEVENTLKHPVKILARTDVADVATCPTIETCGASMGGFTYTPVESAPIADITCKLNRRKQSYFAVSSLTPPEYGCIFVMPVATSTGCK